MFEAFHCFYLQDSHRWVAPGACRLPPHRRQLDRPGRSP
ncbi:hypothetical protein SZ55_0764 [Pseudomonas sp. FeS53a]|nr:hypothetical protein SZ55_0764 [Pseudomonas sp. FeS53a]